jgi:catechol 2,3-dioxygenase-like lactoylglutathione lyase family enzyme
MAVVNHVGLCVTDLDRSRGFYEAVLGFAHQRDLEVPDVAASRLLQIPEPVGCTAVYLERDGFILELLHFDREGNAPPRERSFTEPGLTHISFSVDDIPAARRAWRPGAHRHRHGRPRHQRPRPRRPDHRAPPHELSHGLSVSAEGA